jgi:hypothetical protein
MCLIMLLKLNIKKNQYELCLIWKTVGEHLLTEKPIFFFLKSVCPAMFLSKLAIFCCVVNL